MIRPIVIVIGCIAFIWPVGALAALSLPSPSAPATIGSISLHLVDGARWDPFAPTRTHRSLMVTLWYPAEKTASAGAAYLDPGAARVVDTELAVTPGTFESIRSHARYGATPAVPRGRGYPVVIYSPGFGSFRNAGTALTEELVSRGFVVVTIDHPYDGLAVEFPNGEIATAKPLVVPGNTKTLTYDAWYAMVKPLLAVRVADVRFVLDELAALDAGRNPDAQRRALPSFAGALDLNRIGMFGHSLGGTTTVRVMQVDARIRAGMSLDGPIPEAEGAACIKRPFMLVRSVDPAIERLTVPSWKSASRTLCGRHSMVVLSRSGHNDFTDLTVFARQLAIDQQQRATWLLGSIDADEAVHAERTYVTTYFERYILRSLISVSMAARKRRSSSITASSRSVPRASYVK